MITDDFKEYKQQKLILPEMLIVVCFSTVPICSALQMKVLWCILSFTGLSINVAADVVSDMLTSTWLSCNHNNFSTSMALVQVTTADFPIMSGLVPGEISSPVVCK